jgi:hypothetical protein
MRNHARPSLSACLTPSSPPLPIPAQVLNSSVLPLFVSLRPVPVLPHSAVAQRIDLAVESRSRRAAPPQRANAGHA